MLIALALHVALAFPQRPAMADTVLREALNEAAVIWAPYGLALERGRPCASAEPDTVMLDVDLGGTAPPRGFGAVLGAVDFGPDGMPEPRITLFVDEVLRLVAHTRVLGAAEAAWPQAMRDQIVGRALGRVIAHEIGHYILRQRYHTGAGLMRPLHRADDLVGLSRNGFGLSDEEVAHLIALIAG